MRLSITLVMTWTALRCSGWRVLLVPLCVSIGSAAVLVTMALSRGAGGEIRTLSDQAGKNMFVVKAGRMQTKAVGRSQGWYASRRLKLEDGTALRAEVDGVGLVVPVVESMLPAAIPGRKLATTVRGVTPDYARVRQYRLASGRWFDGDDDARLERVAVLGQFVLAKLNAGTSLLGRTILINRVPFEVIGELRTKGVSADGSNEDDQILVPISTASRRLQNSDFLSSLVVEVEPRATQAVVQQRTRALLRERHRLAPETRDDFELLSMLRTDQAKRMSAGLVQAMSRLFAGVTLGIGALGVFLVTYLNVKERTAEIGLRMALGARPRDILLLFVREALLLSVFGALLGLAMGQIGTVLLESVTGWTLAVVWTDLLAPLALAVALALIFSAVPALKAAALVPMDALRAR